ncbi:ABC transporter substrate-binding protein [Ferrovibrio sp.]|uniref:ABC transporter substrate-binding protein n=1 Tax=Ferrovibrio sp. TaxID=1917215 RepID=UPI003510D48D
MTDTRKISRRGFGRLAAGSFAAGVALPMIGAGARAQDRKAVTFLFDVKPYSKHALFYPALENGYFAKRGLDVTFNAGKGSADVAQKVAAKGAEFGFVDAGTAVLARGRGMPIKLTAMVHYKNMMTVASLREPPIRTPKDLEGLKIAANAGDSVRTALGAVAAINGIDFRKIEFVTVETANKRPLLFAGQVDATCDYAVNMPVYEAAAAKMGKQASQVLFSEFGVDVYSNGILTRDDVLKDDPKLARDFNDAMVESMIFAIENRDEAVKMFLKHNPQSDGELARAGLDVAIEHLLVPEVAEHGIGPMSREKMARTIEIMKSYFNLAGSVSPADMYSNDFVTAGRKPKAA